MGGLELRKPYPREPQTVPKKASPQVRITLLVQVPKRCQYDFRAVSYETDSADQ